MFLCAPISTLFPYTTLFRSRGQVRIPGADVREPVRMARSICNAVACHVHEFASGCVVRKDADIFGRTLSKTERTSLSHALQQDRKSTRLNSSHVSSSYAVFC